MKTREKLNCGTCLYLERDKAFAQPCSQLGKVKTSRACGSFSPNVFAVIPDTRDIDPLRQIGLAIANMSSTELNHLASLLMFEQRTRRLGYRFFQKVYVRVQGSANAMYLNNFAAAYVLDASKEYIRLVGESGKSVYSLLNDSTCPSIWTAEQFRPIRESMVAQGKVTDPSTQIIRPSNSIPSIDDVPAEIIGNSGNRRRGLKKAEKADLVTLVSRMARGALRNRRASEEAIEIVHD